MPSLLSNFSIVIYKRLRHIFPVQINSIIRSIIVLTSFKTWLFMSQHPMLCSLYPDPYKLFWVGSVIKFPLSVLISCFFFYYVSMRYIIVTIYLPHFSCHGDFREQQKICNHNNINAVIPLDWNAPTYIIQFILSNIVFFLLL